MRRWHVPSAGLYAILVAAMMMTAGLMKTINLLILLADLLLILMLINAWLACQSTKNVSIMPLAGGLLSEGQPGRFIYRIRNDGERATAVSVLEISTVRRVQAFVPGLLPGTYRDLILMWPATHRGVYAIEPVVISSGYPFGFVQYRRRVSEPAERIIFPALGRLDLARFCRWLIRTGAGDGRSRRPVARQSPHMADVRGIRGYRSGDNPRHIHWRSTARRNELLVRDYDGPEPLDLVLVVEPFLPAKASLADHQQFEAALSLAATILDAWCRGEGSPRVTLTIMDSQSELHTGRATPGFVPALLTEFARLNGTPTLIELPAELKRYCTARSVRLLVSSNPQDGTLPSRLLLHTGGSFVRITPETEWPWYSLPVANSEMPSAIASRSSSRRG